MAACALGLPSPLHTPRGLGLPRPSVPGRAVAGPAAGRQAVPRAPWWPLEQRLEAGRRVSEPAAAWTAPSDGLHPAGVW